jgi:F-type H+-transporting ATPase subunit b
MAAKTVRDAEEAATLRAEIERLRAMLDAEMESRTVELMKEARARAGQEYDRILADADKKAEQILSAAKVKAERERDVMIEDVKKQVVAVAIDMSGLLLGAGMDSDANRALLSRYLADEDVLS